MKKTLVIAKPEALAVIRKVTRYYKTTYEKMVDNQKCRQREIVRQRQMVMYFLNRKTDLSLAEIGSLFGKDHATALHSIRTITFQVETYRRFRTEVSEISDLLELSEEKGTWDTIKRLTGFAQNPSKTVSKYTWDDVSDFMEAYARSLTPKQMLINFVEYCELKVPDETINQFINGK